MKVQSHLNLTAKVLDLANAVIELESDFEKSISTKLLCKTSGMQIMLIALDAQAELKKHISPGPISVQVLKGSISFRTDETAHNLACGQLLTLEGKLPHSVYANERSIFLVTKSIPE